MSTLRNVVVGLGVATAAFLGYGWYKSRQATKAASAGCSVPLSVDELQSPRGQRMMALYDDCIAGRGNCTQTELQSLLEYLASLCPDNAIEAAWLQATKDSLKNVTPQGGQFQAQFIPQFRDFFSAGIHVAGCGCASCSAKANHSEPCCEACAQGMPCTGACPAKRREPAAVGRA